MFTIVRLRQVISKTSKGVFNFQIRGFLLRRGSEPIRSRLPIQQPSFERIQKSRLTPEGYTVIYVSPLYNHLNFGHALLLISWPLIITYFYVNLYEKGWYKKKIQFMHTSKGAIGVLCLAVPIALHWLLLRNVRVIFRKNDEFKTLIYGFFGPFRKIYIDHGKYAYEKHPLSTFFHYLKNRRIIVFKESFYNELDYYSLIFSQYRDQSYL